MITSANNPLVKRIRSLQAKRRAREDEGVFVIEGLRLAREAVEASLPAELVLHTDHLDERGRAIVNALARLGARVEITSSEVMRACSSAETPPGLLAVLPLPRHPLPRPMTLVLVAAGISDPGNLGTLLRTALAAGVEVVFLTEGSVDPFNPKTVRAGMGAQLRLPILTAAQEELAGHLDRLQVWLAEAHGGTGYFAVDWRGPSALIVGGEAYGPPPWIEALAGGRVSIPMPGKVDSLNASIAAAVILFEIVRQRGHP